MHGLMQRLLAEAVGTAFLLMAVVGSGIAAQRLSPGDVGLQLFENAVATAFALMALIWAFGPVSGAHFNPAVTLADVALKGRPVKEGIAYIGAQVIGGIVGTILANLMFALPAVNWSTKVRSGPDLWLAEVIATLGLLMVIFLIPRRNGIIVAPAVGAYIGAAYFFTSSTSFANPAVTVARMFSDTFAGIQPASAPVFIVMQLVGAALAIGLVWALVGRRR
ncbi:MAG: aquaporin family protein [Chloroflexi bacterium]|nr:aquaporin family protein [Chloroflexota bacterium]MYD48735.1 aquaporin family protein [Chloroflexota bacterium]